MTWPTVGRLRGDLNHAVRVAMRLDQIRGEQTLHDRHRRRAAVARRAPCGRRAERTRPETPQTPPYPPEFSGDFGDNRHPSPPT